MKKADKEEVIVAIHRRAGKRYFLNSSVDIISWNV